MASVANRSVSYIDEITYSLSLSVHKYNTTEVQSGYFHAFS